MVKGVLIIVLAAAIVFGGYHLIKENKKLETEISDLSKRLETLKREKEEIMEQINFFKQPENLLKAVKEQFNYHEAGEHLIIIIPTSTSAN